jgi:hypothetical protein
MRQGDAAISPTLLCNFVDRNRAQLLADAAAQELLCYEVWIYPASHIDNKHLQEAGGRFWPALHSKAFGKPACPGGYASCVLHWLKSGRAARYGNFHTKQEIGIMMRRHDARIVGRGAWPAVLGPQKIVALRGCPKTFDYGA